MRRGAHYRMYSAKSRRSPVAANLRSRTSHSSVIRSSSLCSKRSIAFIEVCGHDVRNRRSDCSNSSIDRSAYTFGDDGLLPRVLLAVFDLEHRLNAPEHPRAVEGRLVRFSVVQQWHHSRFVDQENIRCYPDDGACWTSVPIGIGASLSICSLPYLL